MLVGRDCIGIGCGVLIFNEKEEVLLVKRTSKARTEPGYWSRPGGEIHPGEHIEMAVTREVKEEIGIEIELINFLEFTEIITKEKNTHWIAFGYLAKAVGGIAKNNEPEKHDDVQWCPLSKLPEPLTTYTLNSLKAYQKLKKKKNYQTC